MMKRLLADLAGAASGAVHHLRAPLTPDVKVSVGNGDLTLCPNQSLGERQSEGKKRRYPKCLGLSLMKSLRNIIDYSL